MRTSRGSVQHPRALAAFLFFRREDIITVAPQDGVAEVGETNQLSKGEAVIGNVTSCPPGAKDCCLSGLFTSIHTNSTDKSITSLSFTFMPVHRH